LHTPAFPGFLVSRRPGPWSAIVNFGPHEEETSRGAFSIVLVLVVVLVLGCFRIEDEDDDEDEHDASMREPIL
jgi:hypothetical protein